MRCWIVKSGGDVSLKVPQDYNYYRLLQYKTRPLLGVKLATGNKGVYKFPESIVSGLYGIHHFLDQCIISETDGPAQAIFN